jgi:hypothetical protein
VEFLQKIGFLIIYIFLIKPFLYLSTTLERIVSFIEKSFIAKIIQFISGIYSFLKSIGQVILSLLQKSFFTIKLYLFKVIKNIFGMSKNIFFIMYNTIVTIIGNAFFKNYFIV